MKKPVNIVKTETVEEFLARGGTITYVSSKEAPKPQKKNTRGFQKMDFKKKRALYVKQF